MALLTLHVVNHPISCLQMQWIDSELHLNNFIIKEILQKHPENHRLVHLKIIQSKKETHLNHPPPFQAVNFPGVYSIELN